MIFLPCFHPLIGVDVGIRSPEGKPLYQIKHFPEDLRPGIDLRVKYAPYDQSRFVPCGPNEGFSYVTIPCGKCIGCRLESSRQWANRCLLELEYHDSAYFVTLTYDDYHVPISYYPDPETGEAQPSLTLCKRDVQLFMKRLRDRFRDQEIRFFMCGEYGPNTFRPHYHLILFGLSLPDLQYVGDIRGHRYYSSQLLERCWSRKGVMQNLFGEECVTPLAKIGNVTIEDVTWETCAYTARYITKKLTGPAAKFYSDFNIEPPFVNMSRRPGIARQWYEDHPNMRDFEYINIKTAAGGKKFRPPKYYDKIFDGEFPEESARIKAIRQKMCLESIRAKLERTDLNYIEYLAVEENKLKSRTKSLKREDV